MFHLMFLSEWREFPSVPCLAGKKNLVIARVSMLLKSLDWYSGVSLSGCVVTDTALLKYRVL